ncbi:pyroglutamyl-peptidase I [Ureibacillus sinduriensis]|uniref:Pyroglutamyl-peptidase I n=1 Tax=Ureibacillus sinduriensis BLB-1 = JCM 15800 TaxID=1384057 RepID=A0A0A3HN62_9BACL|nr:pyroglutamyl-peptidase I [Ureibacillus sinduriensis]KGR74011.1 peptidase C15 [Ureibacillus sinduriensis BLB-1 = JCM 15800]
MKKILLTGFEPFLNYKINPTMQVVDALNGKIMGGYEICSRIMSVDFQEASNQLENYINEVEPDIIISLGLAGGRYKITPERIAINMKDGEPDNHGHAPIDEKIDENGVDAYLTNLPIRKMVERLNKEGYPAEISNSAGTYLCNNIMYEGLAFAKQQRNVLAGFIHIPASFELAILHGKIPGWNVRDLIDGVQLCIEETVNFVRDSNLQN